MKKQKRDCEETAKPTEPRKPKETSKLKEVVQLNEDFQTESGFIAIKQKQSHLKTLHLKQYQNLSYLSNNFAPSQIARPSSVT
jgi:hypothetical protein